MYDSCKNNHRTIAYFPLIWQRPVLMQQNTWSSHLTALTADISPIYIPRASKGNKIMRKLQGKWVLVPHRELKLIICDNLSASENSNMSTKLWEPQKGVEGGQCDKREGERKEKGAVRNINFTWNNHFFVDWTLNILTTKTWQALSQYTWWCVCFLYTSWLFLHAVSMSCWILKSNFFSSWLQGSYITNITTIKQFCARFWQYSHIIWHKTKCKNGLSQSL